MTNLPNLPDIFAFDEDNSDGTITDDEHDAQQASSGSGIISSAGEEDYDYDYDYPEPTSSLSSAGLRDTEDEPEDAVVQELDELDRQQQEELDSQYIEVLTDEYGHTFDIDEVLSAGVEAGAADVRVKPYDEVVFKILGSTVRQPQFGRVHPRIIEAVRNIIVRDSLARPFNLEGGVDTSYVIRKGPHAGRRSRLNVSRTMDDPMLAFRIINDDIPRPEDIGVPDEMLSWLDRGSGLVMVCGKTGSGKSTTLASMLDLINRTKALSILTIERPVEYVLGNDGMGETFQREVGPGLDSPSFSRALVDGLRQAPDVILVGEVRNQDEMSTLLDAADSGHLSLTTMHTNTVPNTLSRIKTIFDNQAARVFDSIAASGIGLANQLLILTPDKQGRNAVHETVSLDDDDARELIRRGDDRGLYDWQMDNERSMEHMLAQAIIRGEIDRDSAFSASPRRGRLKDVLKQMEA